MKLNKIILSGIILIFFSGFLFFTDILTPIIRPITYLFLMGSSKGKDILFFALLGFFLIVSQLKIKTLNPKKSLLTTIILAIILLAMGIFLEVYLRYQLGIDLNTIFATIRPEYSTTSIIHTHLIKSVLGNFLINTIGPFIGSGINTGSALYSYIAPFTAIVVILLALLFVFMILSMQNQPTAITILLSLFSAILLIGCIDGGLFGTPGITGFIGTIIIYKNGSYITHLNNIKHEKQKLIDFFKPYNPIYIIKDKSWKRTDLSLYIPYILCLFIIILRFSICFIGANPEYYEVDIFNPDENINLDSYPIESITHLDNETIYYLDSSINEMNLTNSLSENLNNSCDYYTVSWNIYSYF